MKGSYGKEVVCVVLFIPFRVLLCFESSVMFHITTRHVSQLTSSFTSHHHLITLLISQLTSHTHPLTGHVVTRCSSLRHPRRQTALRHRHALATNPHCQRHLRRAPLASRLPRSQGPNQPPRGRRPFPTLHRGAGAPAPVDRQRECSHHHSFPEGVFSTRVAARVATPRLAALAALPRIAR